MDVSKNSGFYPQIIHFDRVFRFKPSILGENPLFLETPICSTEMSTVFGFEDQDLKCGFRYGDVSTAGLRSWFEHLLPSVGWWFQMVFYFHPYLRKRSKMTSIIFQMGWKHQLDQTSSESFNFYRQSHRYLPGASIIPVLLQPMSRLKACVPCQSDVCVVIGLGHCVQWVCLTFGIAWITGRNILENITNPWIKAIYYWVVVSKICYVHPENWGRFPNLTNIFQRGWSNYQLDYIWMFPKIMVPPNHPFQ